MSESPKDERIDGMLEFERMAWERGFSFVAGVDEAGRGPLAGPVVVAAVLFPKGAAIPPVDDSKKLTESRRLELREEILSVPGVETAVVEISAERVDELNILGATHEGMRLALERLESADFALVDGLKVPNLPVPAEFIVKGDSRSASVAAASVLAKTRRDEIMVELDGIYPGYGFAVHKGYGTKTHLEALARLGPSPVHRRSFKPVRDAIDPPPEQMELGLFD